MSARKFKKTYYRNAGNSKGRGEWFLNKLLARVLERMGAE